jgi:putative transcriptional regulator
MATKRKFKSDMSETIHSAAAMLHKVGAMDKTTMLEFDSRHFVPNEMAPQKLNRQHC